MPTSSPDSARDTRNRLLEAALVVFAEKGFDGAGIRDIAARAQVNSAMVQYHFGGKEGLYLAVMRHTFELGTQWVKNLQPVPELGQPGAHGAALERIHTYIGAFLDHILTGGHGVLASEELDRAADLLWNREMQYTRPALEPFLLESIRPFADYLHGCLKVLRPDLDDEGRLRMGFSIQALLMWIHSHMGLVRILRGTPYAPADLDSLTEHFYRFVLGGLGLAPDAPEPGA
jgi:TetR/AcrR family transcriptional regulator, regulator of cefoperazone and chloramphenicol sensitivity